MIESRSSNFRRVNGVMFAFAGIDIDVHTGKELERSTVGSIKVNPALDPAIFDKL